VRRLGLLEAVYGFEDREPAPRPEDAIEFLEGARFVLHVDQDRPCGDNVHGSLPETGEVFGGSL